MNLTTIKTTAIHTVIKIYRYFLFVIRRFMEDDCIYRASALTFTSLLAIVPLMSVTVTILAAFPVFKKLVTPVQNFIFTNFIPATGQVVQTYLQGFAAQASKLSVLGMMFLLVTAVLMMFTIERAMNQIWRVRIQRKGISAFLLYWAVLSLAPVLMGLSFAVSSYLISLPLLSGAAATFGISKKWFLQMTPFILTVVTFTFLYVAVPNCKVRFWHGFVGALVSAILFELAKLSFRYYLSSYDTYELLYGAFATVPLFFLWVYWVWIIVLLGGEVAHAFSAYYDRRLGEKIDGFTHAFLWLGHLHQAQQRGTAMAMRDLIDADRYNYQVEPDEQLTQLLKVRLIQPTLAGRFVLSRDLSTMNVSELHALLPWKFPKTTDLQRLPGAWEKALQKLLSEIEPARLIALKQAVASLYQ